METLESRYLLSGATDLKWSTFLGGRGLDAPTAMALSPDGSVYVTGTTHSVDFPTTPGVFDETFNSSADDVLDAFLAKLSADGSTLLWSTFLGGSEGDVAYGIAVDREGAVYVAGRTMSPDFPTTPGAYLESLPHPFHPANAFVSKFSADGALDWSTLLGGSHSDEVWAIAVDPRGDVYVTGQTFGGFPTTEGAYDREFGGAASGFVTKLAAGGSKLLWSTYLGGYITSMNDIVLDNEGNVYVGGSTFSSTFPTTPDAFDTSFSYPTDAFVSKLSPLGDALVWSTFLGGTDGDTVQGLDVDGSGSVYAVGASVSWDFPTTPGSYRHPTEGPCGAFVTKIAPDGTSLAYGACLGRFASPIPVAMTAEGDAAGSATVGGFAHFAPDFPTTTDGYDTSFDGPSDGFVVQLTPAGDALTYGTLIGGQSVDQVSSIAIAPGSLWVAGGTLSADFPVTDGGYDRTFNGPAGGGWSNNFLAGDAFILKLQFRSAGPHIQSMSPDSPVIGPVRSVRVTFSEPIDLPSFTAEDISLVGPAGPIPIRRIRHISDTTFRLRFPQQTLLGEYHLTLGPDVRDLAGNLMDQDQDGQSGEVTEDQFSASFHIVPRTFVFFFTGKDSPAEGSGMEKLRGAIAGDPVLSKLHVLAPVFGWPEGTRPKTQRLAAQAFVQSFLTTQKADLTSDRVVLIGHSYGGNIAYGIAPDLDRGGPGTAAASGLVLFDPIDWQHIKLRRAHFHPDQSNAAHVKSPLEGTTILNFVQRNPNRVANSDLYGYEIVGQENHQFDDTTHFLIDNDRGVDDAVLGIYENVLDSLRPPM